MPDFNQMQRERLAARNQAMPDGGFPIRNVSDLKNAIQSFGRAKNKPAVKAWIKKRAKDLGREDLLPDNWRTDALMHYGVKGQKWGVRRYQNKNGRYTAAGLRRLRKDVKETRKNAQRENVEGRVKGSTGKNFDEAYKKMNEKLDSFDKKWTDRYITEISRSDVYDKKTGLVDDALLTTRLNNLEKKILSRRYFSCPVDEHYRDTGDT